MKELKKELEEIKLRNKRVELDKKYKPNNFSIIKEFLLPNGWK